MRLNGEAGSPFFGREWSFFVIPSMVGGKKQYLFNISQIEQSQLGWFHAKFKKKFCLRHAKWP
jgi:hypothetical protein